MYGKYAWNAGATAANVLADLNLLIGGSAVAALSASCNKAGSSVAGAACPWVGDDVAYGVYGVAPINGGVRKQVRITCTTILQLAAVEAWNAGTHAPLNATAAKSVSLAIATAGSVNFSFTDEVFLLGASDWTLWGFNAEVKRDGPLLTDVAAPNYVNIYQDGVTTFPRLKNPGATGDLAPSAANWSGGSYTPAIATTATRDRTETLYISMVPAIVASAATGGVPVGELQNVMVAGGYGLSGDSMLDGSGNTWLLDKSGQANTPIFATLRK